MKPSFTFYRTFDADLIKTVLTHPKVWPYIIDDNCSSPEAFTPPIIDNLIYAKVFGPDTEFLGLWILARITPEQYEIHTCLLPIARGLAVDAGKQFLKWAFRSTKCLRITTKVPAPNRLALRLAKGTGFKEIGRNEKAMPLNGELVDYILLEVKKEDVI